MVRCAGNLGGCVGLLIGLTGVVVRAQDSIPQQLEQLRKQVGALRQLDSLSANDQATLREWLTAELNMIPNLDPDEPDVEKTYSIAMKAFFEAFNAQRDNSSNKPAFAAQLAAQTAAVARTMFADAGAPVMRSVALSSVLLGLDRKETLPGLRAGLQSKIEAVRYDCALALARRHADLLADNQLVETIADLKQVAVREQNPAVLGAMYRALSVRGHVGQVFDAIVAVLDARIAAARKGAVRIRKDLHLPFDYLLQEQGELSADQNAALVRRIAVLLRVAAEQLNGDVRYEDQINIEMAMTSMEDLLERITGTGGGIRKALAERKDDLKSAVLAAAQAWVGTTQTPGVLNRVPYNVQRGAP